MRYLVDLTQKEAEEIKRFINAGKYQTVSQFISTAIENQIYIEGSGSESLSSILVTKKTPEILNRPDLINTKDNSNIALAEIKSHPKAVVIPNFSGLAASLYYNAKEENCWLWGQTNKIFPVKIGLRVLYALIGSEQWLDLEEYKEKAADVATEYGAAIRKYEDKKNKMRDERISAGLPDGEFKSKFRYKGHFLAYMRKDGKLDGAMPFLRFANLNKDEKGRIFIGLTEPGLNFALIENPVIDRNDFEKSFSQAEIDFYLDYVSTSVRGEASAIGWVLKKITEGVNDRDAINKALSREIAPSWGETSEAVVNTQRAGLMARMFELGLIEKEKKGISVRYKVSARGSDFLQKFKGGH